MAFILSLDGGIPGWGADNPLNQTLFEVRDRNYRVYGAVRGHWSRGPKGGHIYTYTVYDIHGNILLETRREKDCRDEALYDPTQFITERFKLTRLAPVNLDPQPVGARGGPLVR